MFSISSISVAQSTVIPTATWTLGLKGVTTNGSSYVSPSYESPGITESTKTWSGTHVTIGGYASATKVEIHDYTWTYGNNKTVTRPNSRSCKFYIKY